MARKDCWLLPEAIEERISLEATCIETACRFTLDLFNYWGYNLVIPLHFVYRLKINQLFGKK